MSSLMDVCTKCNVQCKFQERDDKFVFRCPINKCRQVFTVSPENFWLSTRIPYNKVLLIIYFFVTEVKLNLVSLHLEISQQSMVDWFNFCREVKLKIPSRGRSQHHLIGYFAAFMWNRKYDPKDRFQKFIDASQSTKC
ncbi:hypothetical protein Avbf_05801 [Armadillidium vulgare]|nr:hypothetical protein Avbf_05801 [Armadillidium vulgare]